MHGVGAARMNGKREVGRPQCAGGCNNDSRPTSLLRSEEATVCKLSRVEEVAIGFLRDDKGVQGHEKGLRRRVAT